MALRPPQELSHDQRFRILSTPACHTPLFLIVAVTELCAFGEFEKLNDKIADLLRAKVSCACRAANQFCVAVWLKFDNPLLFFALLNSRILKSFLFVCFAAWIPTLAPGPTMTNPQ